MGKVEVLIVGAGPTGLALALFLTRLGVRARIIDKAAEPGTTSRALVFHARNLEFYEQSGLARTALAESVKFTAVNLWARGKHASRVEFGDMGQGLSPFPYALIYPQDQHERIEQQGYEARDNQQQDEVPEPEQQLGGKVRRGDDRDRREDRPQRHTPGLGRRPQPSAPRRRCSVRLPHAQMLAGVTNRGP